MRDLWVCRGRGEGGDSTFNKWDTGVAAQQIPGMYNAA